MPFWFNVSTLRSALSLGRHRIESAEDAADLVDRLRRDGALRRREPTPPRVGDCDRPIRKPSSRNAHP